MSERPSVPYDVHEREMLAVIAERDRAEEWADTLASLLAPPEVLGEHSSLNNPWQNAVEHAEQSTPNDPDVTGGSEPESIKPVAPSDHSMPRDPA